MTVLMPKHGVNVVDEDSFVVYVKDISTPLMTVKNNLLLAGSFPGCGEGFHLCAVLPTGFHLLESGVQRLMDNKEILFEKTFVPLVPVEVVAIITIFDNSSTEVTNTSSSTTLTPRPCFGIGAMITLGVSGVQIQSP